MYPLKTNVFSFTTALSQDKFETYLKSGITEKQLMQIRYDNIFYGTIEPGYSKLELGQTPTKNAFRPIVILHWKPIEKGTEISAYFRMDRRIIAINAGLPLTGIFISIQEQLMLPFILTTLFSILLVFGLLQFAYRKSQKQTITYLTELFKNLKGIKGLNIH